MRIPRPTAPRIEPVEKVVAVLRERNAGSEFKPYHVRATLAHNRAVAKAMAVLSDLLINDGSVPPRRRELVIMRMGWNAQAVYEFGHHAQFGQRVGVTADEVYLVTRPLVEGAWDELDRALLQMTDDLYLDDCVSDATWSELARLLSPGEIIEYLIIAQNWRTASAILNSFGIQREESVPGWPQPPEQG